MNFIAIFPSISYGPLHYQNVELRLGHANSQQCKNALDIKINARLNLRSEATYHTILCFLRRFLDNCFFRRDSVIIIVTGLCLQSDKNTADEINLKVKSHELWFSNTVGTHVKNQSNFARPLRQMVSLNCLNQCSKEML